MAKLHIKKRPLIIAMAGIVLTIFIADGVKRGLYKPSTKDSVVNKGHFLTTPSNGKNEDVTIIGFDENELVREKFTGSECPGYKKAKFTTADLSSGMLTIITDQHPASSADTRTPQVYLESFCNDTYSVVDENAMLNKEAAIALNKMMTDYNKATDLSDFIVYGTTNTYTASGPCAREIPERVTGNTIDLALAGYSGVIGYDGFDEEGWVVQNCAKYGFIVRYPEGKSQITGQKYCPWHLRYVGEVHAALMTENNMCLEEYIDFLKGYTQSEPYNCKVGSKTYDIYTCAAEGESTEVLVPVRGNYDRSGDNIGTYIITVTKK